MFKDQDQDKDLNSKDKDKDCIVKDKDQDQDCILVLKESLRRRTNITVINVYPRLLICKLGFKIIMVLYKQLEE